MNQKDQKECLEYCEAHGIYPTPGSLWKGEVIPWGMEPPAFYETPIGKNQHPEKVYQNYGIIHYGAISPEIVELPQSKSEWYCSYCGRANHYEREECKGCGAPRMEKHD